jgi:hypothetical protein
MLLDELLQHACIFSRGPLDFPAKWRRAERIRVEHPELATASIHAAVVCGEVDRVREFLRDDPSLVTQRGGPQAWEPLLYACYGRMPNDRFAEHSVEIVHVLLDAGASARTYFVHRDGDVRFTALTGVMGQGEMGAPGKHGHLALHMACEDPAIVDLLLAHGADPRARCFGGTATGWARHAGNHAMARTLAERSRDLLDAVTAGHVELARELLREDPSRIDARSPKGATVLHVLPDDPAIARELVVLLRDHGADSTRVDHEGRDAVRFLRNQGLDEIADLL